MLSALIQVVFSKLCTSWEPKIGSCYCGRVSKLWSCYCGRVIVAVLLGVLLWLCYGRVGRIRHSVSTSLEAGKSPVLPGIFLA